MGRKSQQGLALWVQGKLTALPTFPFHAAPTGGEGERAFVYASGGAHSQGLALFGWGSRVIWYYPLQPAMKVE